MSLVATQLFLFFFLVDPKTLLQPLQGWQRLHSNLASTTKYIYIFGSGPLGSTLDGDPMCNPYLEVYVYIISLLITHKIINMGQGKNGEPCTVQCSLKITPPKKSMHGAV